MELLTNNVTVLGGGACKGDNDYLRVARKMILILLWNWRLCDRKGLLGAARRQEESLPWSSKASRLQNYEKSFLLLKPSVCRFVVTA